jgi:hypothetical protein
LQLVLHVDRRGGDEGVDARDAGVFYRLGAAVDVLGGGARQAGDGGVFHPAGDFRHGFEIALRGDGEAGLDDIDAQSVQNVGDFQFFFKTHRGAGALLAIAQGGVEDIDAVGSGGGLRFGHGFNPGIFSPRNKSTGPEIG